MSVLHFYYAAMNAGKTLLLLKLQHSYTEQEFLTMAFTPHFDNRFQEGWIISRLGLKAPATTFDENFDFIQAVSSKTPRPHCIFVDEAQFLTRAHVEQLSRVVDDLNISVFAYGLRTDFQGQLFEGSAALFALADVVTELSAVCHCGREAMMNLRIDEDQNPVLTGNQIEIGGSEKYQSVCRKHYLELCGDKALW